MNDNPYISGAEGWVSRNIQAFSRSPEPGPLITILDVGAARQRTVTIPRVDASPPWVRSNPGQKSPRPVSKRKPLVLTNWVMSPTSATAGSLPSVQAVWKIVRKGDPAKALVKEENAPVPTKIPEGCVLVRIRAASLNPAYV